MYLHVEHMCLSFWWRRVSTLQFTEFVLRFNSFHNNKDAVQWHNQTMCIRKCIKKNAAVAIRIYKIHGWDLDGLHPDLVCILQAQWGCHTLRLNSTVSCDLFQLKNFISLYWDLFFLFCHSCCCCSSSSTFTTTDTTTTTTITT